MARGINLLTDAALKGKLTEARKSGKVAYANDGAGLLFEALPDGKRGRWRYRFKIDGRENRISLGDYPDTPLSLAREERQRYAESLASKVSPAELRKAETAAATAARAAAALQGHGKPLPGSFEYVAREWLERIHENKVSTAHARRTCDRFEKDIFPWLGRRPVAEIEPPELLATLSRIVDRGAIETAHRAKDACGQVFRYGVACGYCARNPAADLRDALPSTKTRHHAAILDPAEVARLLRDMEAYKGHPITRAALRLSALLLLRPGELRHLRWAWVNFDASMITLPSELMKRTVQQKLTGPDHLVPLAPQAVAILHELRALTGAGEFLFPSLTSSQRCMSENTVRSALRRMGYDNETMTAHGFRAMFRTLADERLGIPGPVIEAQMDHAVTDSLGRAYNRTQYLDQRRAMMQRWACYLDELKADKVIPFHGSAAA